MKTRPTMSVCRSSSISLTTIVNLLDRQLFPQKPLNDLASLARIVVAMTGGAASQYCLLPNRPLFLQNYMVVILRGEGGAPLHPLAGASAMPGVRPGGLLPRERRLLPRSQAHLRGLSRSDRVPQLCAPARRALRRVGRHERTGTATPETYGVLTGGKGVQH